MRYKLIAMDLDGTLNNDTKQITEKTRAALMDAQEKGIRLALASARPSPGLYRERDVLRLQDHQGILMSYNGGRIVDAATGNEEDDYFDQNRKDILRNISNLKAAQMARKGEA